MDKVFPRERCRPVECFFKVSVGVSKHRLVDFEQADVPCIPIECKYKRLKNSRT